MSTKVRLKLVQPAIMCSGRDEVVCYYRGKILEEGYDEEEKLHYKLIQFKIHGEIGTACYYENLGFLHPDFEDIKIVS